MGFFPEDRLERMCITAAAKLNKNLVREKCRRRIAQQNQPAGGRSDYRRR
jgi:hypothetical protein